MRAPSCSCWRLDLYAYLCSGRPEGIIKSVIRFLIVSLKGFGMPAIYPSVALKNQQREIKAIADTEIVHITENGRGKYVFMSEAVLQRTIDQAVEEALYEARLRYALQESRKDFEDGRFYSTRDDLMAAVAEKRSRYA